MRTPHAQIKLRTSNLVSRLDSLGFSLSLYTTTKTFSLRTDANIPSSFVCFASSTLEKISVISTYSAGIDLRTYAQVKRYYYHETNPLVSSSTIRSSRSQLLRRPCPYHNPERRTHNPLSYNSDRTRCLRSNEVDILDCTPTLWHSWRIVSVLVPVFEAREFEYLIERHDYNSTYIEDISHAVTQIVLPS